MSKTKKFLSLLAAAAISVSSFAGMTIGVRADTKVYVTDFSDKSTAGWGQQRDAGNYGATFSADKEYLSIHESSLKRQQGLHYTLGENTGAASKTSSKYVALDFDIMLCSASANEKNGNVDNSCRTYFRVLSTHVNNKDNAVSGNGNDIFTLSIPGKSGDTKMPVTINYGDTISETTFECTRNSNSTVHPGLAGSANAKGYGTTPWLTVKTIFDFENYTVSYEIYDRDNENTLLKKDTIALLNKDTKPSEIKKLYATCGKGLGGMLIDNISLRDLAVPSFDLSATTVTVSDSVQNETDTVKNTVSVTLSNLSYVKDNSIIVKSNDKSVATADVSGNTITITGAGSGRTTIDVSATSSESDYVVVHDTITVDSGTVATYNVSVNYYITGSQNPVPGRTSDTVTKAKNEPITKSDLNSSYIDADTGSFSNAIDAGAARYVYNKTATGEDNDGILGTVLGTDNQAISIFFDKQSIVTSLAVKYTDGESDLSDVTQPANITVKADTNHPNGYFATDTYNDIYVPKYIIASDGKLYSTPADENKPGPGYYRRPLVLQEGTNEQKVTYTEDSRKAVFYAEGESIGTASIVASRDIRCSMGDAGTIGTKAEDVVNVTTLTPGKYNIEAAIWGGNNAENSTNDTYTFKCGSINALSLTSTGSVATKNGDFTVYESTPVTVSNDHTGGKDSCLDYVLITKTADLHTLTANIEDAVTGAADDHSVDLTATQTADDDKLASAVTASIIAASDVTYASPTIKWEVSYGEGAGQVKRTRTQTFTESIVGDGTTANKFAMVFKGINLKLLNATATVTLTSAPSKTAQ